MARQTSVAAYRSFVASGMAATRRGQAYRTLYHHGPLTGNELAQMCNVPGMWKRLSELKTMSVAREVGTRTCRVTGETALEWDVTAHIPKAWKYDRPEPRIFYGVKRNGLAGLFFNSRERAVKERAKNQAWEFIELKEVI